MTSGLPTFQQTFANCPFPEEVLAVLGSYPVQVRVLKARRAMEVVAKGAVVSQEILTQASDVLKRTFGLSAAAVEIDSPQPFAQELSAQEKGTGFNNPPSKEKEALGSAAEKPSDLPKAPDPPKNEPQDLEAQMKAGEVGD